MKLHFGSAVVSLGALALLIGCGDSQLSQTTVTLSSQLHPEAKSSGTFNETTAEQKLPQQLCYVIHVSGPGLTEIPGDADVCGPESGQGYMTPRAYRVGETAEIVLSSTRSPRVFELIGFQSPLGVDAEGEVRCGSSAVIEYQAVDDTTGDTANAANAPEQRHTHFKLKIDGQKVTGGLVKFYSGEKVSLAPGPETVTLFRWPKSGDDLVKSFPFGVPFFRQDIADEKPAECLATGQQIPVDISQNQIETAATNLSSPKTNTNGITLNMLSSAPFMLPDSAAIIGTGGRKLNLGFPKLEKDLEQ